MHLRILAVLATALALSIVPGVPAAAQEAGVFYYLLGTIT